MKIFITALSMLFASQLAIAEPSYAGLAEYFKFENVPTEQNAYAALEALPKVDVKDVKDNLNCSKYYGESYSYIPVTDFSCIDKAALNESWVANSDIVLQYQDITELPRFYGSKHAESYLQKIININKLITTKIELSLSELDYKLAHSLWTRNVRFLQNALSDKQTLADKSILLVAYGYYERLAPTMLTTSFDSEQKAEIRNLLSYRVADRQNGWDIKESLNMEYNLITSSEGMQAIQNEFALEMYNLSEDAIKLYDYDYPEIERKADEVIAKYSIGEPSSFANLSKEETTAKLLTAGIAQSLKLLSTTRRNDLLVRIALISY